MIEYEVINEEIETEATEFTIDTDEKAEWALKKVLAAKKEKERLTALIEAERESLDRKQEEVDKRFENDTSYMLFKLKE